VHYSVNFQSNQPYAAKTKVLNATKEPKMDRIRLTPETDEEAIALINQDVKNEISRSASVGLYQCHRELGLSISDALIEVWTTHIDSYEKKAKETS